MEHNNTASMLAHLSQGNLDELKEYGYVVVPKFLEDTEPFREDLLALRSAGHFAVAKIGHNGQIQDSITPFRDIRVSETCSLWHEDHRAKTLPFSSARDKLYEQLDSLKADIGSNDEMALDEKVQEVMYAWYPNGGYYRRHVDAEEATSSMFRTYSFLLYLSDWKETEGGCLRLHFDSGRDEKPASDLPCFVDVPPTAGTLVIFRSDLLPHEVLAFYGSQRMAIVGWFWGEAPVYDKPAISLDPQMIEKSALELLLQLRYSVPNLKSSKLAEANHPEYQSGVLHDDNDAWGIVMPSAPQPPPETNNPVYKETHALYWKELAKFHPITGQLVTLCLSGLRFRKLSLRLSSDLDLSCLTTLDLSNTDMAPELMVAFLRTAVNLKFIRLGGNGWADISHIRQVAAAVSETVEIIDCRYSNWTAERLQTFLVPDEKSYHEGLQKLYLEGNSIGDNLEPLVSWINDSSRLRELFLGQNRIGPNGAKQLAGIECQTLSKLYLEGNRIGALGANALLESKFLHHLEKLYVENNDIPKDLSLQLGHALQSPTMIGEGGLFQ